MKKDIRNYLVAPIFAELFRWKFFPKKTDADYFIWTEYLW
jgi:hypothetical protein